MGSPLRVFKPDYRPSHSDNRMSNEGNLQKARAVYFQKRPSNLVFLLKTRYEWMNAFLKEKKKVVELGAGAGLSKEFIKNPNHVLTDVSGEDWIDEYVDATQLPFKKNSVDAYICSHFIHHLAFPSRFLIQAAMTLKPGGVILISDLYFSFMAKAAFRLMRHEGWMESVDPFDDSKPSNDPKDPWSANIAIPMYLFSSKERFEKEFPELELVSFEPCEFLIFVISGGVIAKTKTIHLPEILLKVVHAVDTMLVTLFPRIFAMGCRVIVRKRSKETK